MRKPVLLLLLLCGPLLAIAETAEELLQSAIALGAKRNFAEANRVLTKLLETDLPKEMRLRALMVRGGSRNAGGDRIGALVDFDDAIKLQPDNPRCYFYRAETLRAGGREDEAEKDYLMSLKLDPKPATVWIRLGEMKSDQHNYAAAIASFTQAIEVDPNQSLGYARRATARANSGDHVGAIAEMDAVIARFPSDATLYHYRGLIKYHPRSSAAVEEALPDFNKAIELDPNQARFYKDRANCRSMLGDIEGANADVAKCNELVHTGKN